jgi:hypothetical protein
MLDTAGKSLPGHATIRLLHVEDDSAQQRLVAFDLGKLAEYRFEIVCTRSEDEAVAAFQRDGADDFIAKGELATQKLMVSVRTALVRSQRLATPGQDRSRRQCEQFAQLCAALVDGVSGPAAPAGRAGGVGAPGETAGGTGAPVPDRLRRARRGRRRWRVGLAAAAAGLARAA